MYKLTHYKKKKKKKRKKYDSVPKNMWDKGVCFQSKESLGKYNWEIKMTCYCGMVHVLSNDFNEIYNSRG